MKGKRFFVLILILSAAMLMILLRWNRGENYLPVMEANWNLSFPDSAHWSLLYETYSGPSPHGDGWRYHVFSYEQEEAVAQMVSWTSETGDTIFSETYADACEMWLDQIQVPDNMRPAYSSCQAFYSVQSDHSQLLIFWNKENKTVSFAELFI